MSKRASKVKAAPITKPYSKRAFKEIAQALGAEAAAQEVVQAACWYVGNLKLLDPSTRTPRRDAQQKLQALAVQVMEIPRAVEGLSFIGHQALTRVTGLDAGRNFADAAWQFAEALSRAATSIERKPSPKGHPRLAAREVFIERVAEIYEKATGLPNTISAKTKDPEAAHGGKEGQPYGPYFDFLKLCFAGLPGLGKLHDHALASAAKRARQSSK